MMYADRIDTSPRYGLTFPPHLQQSRCSIPPRCFYHFLLFLLIVCIDFQVSREQMVDGDDLRLSPKLGVTEEDPEFLRASGHRCWMILDNFACEQ